jgi:nucleoside-triphosphatase THEP1
MKIRHNEIEISSEKPFSNCKLNRQPYATVLTEIIESYSDGFVLAINNEWGTGKTTFVKMWRQSLSNSGFRTIYFNAWENDFNNDPLVAIMSELQNLVNDKVNGDKVFKSVVEKGAILSKNVLPVLARSLLKKYVVDVDMISDVIENTTKSATEILEEGIKDYTQRKKSITEFRSELEEFVKNAENSKPIIFIIDELDRCRPTYAVEVLEQLKHFFSVNGIVFILSIDKKHLASSIKGFYGTSEINTDEYLRRFIDLEYSIPRPSNKLFCKYLFEYYNLGDFFNSINRRHILDFQKDSDHLIKMAELLFDKTNATLRQQEKVFGMTRLILNSFRHNQFTFPILLFVLIYIKLMQNEFYHKIELNALTVQQLCDRFVELMPSDIQNKYGLNLLYVVALLLYFYNNSQNEKDKIKLLEIDTPDNKSTSIKIRFGNYESQELAKQFSKINIHPSYYNGSLDYLLLKINLTESLIIN